MRCPVLFQKLAKVIVPFILPYIHNSAVDLSCMAEYATQEVETESFTVLNKLQLIPPSQPWTCVLKFVFFFFFCVGYLSWRSHVWTDVDNDRCGTLPFVFDDDFGFDRYVEYALDVPMYFVYR